MGTPLAPSLARSQRAIVGAYTVIALVYCAASTWLYYGPAANPFEAQVHLLSFLVIAPHYLVLQPPQDSTLAPPSLIPGDRARGPRRSPHVPSRATSGGAPPSR